MKLYSDLHLDVSQCEVDSPCLIAGDIDGMPKINGDISQVYSIKGNHDFWDGRHNQATPGRELINEAVKLPDGRTLFGGTMWTDWAWPVSYVQIPDCAYLAYLPEVRELDKQFNNIVNGIKIGMRICKDIAPDARAPRFDLERAVHAGSRHMNDYRYGRQPGDSNAILSPIWTLSQHKAFLSTLKEACMETMGDWEFQDDFGRPTAIPGKNVTNHMLVMSHHCPIQRSSITRFYDAQRYDAYPELFPAYYSPAIARMLATSYEFNAAVRDHGMTWCYGHTHEAVDILIRPFVKGEIENNDFCFYMGNYGKDSYEECEEMEFSWTMEVNTNPEYKDIPGVIRVISNPRGYCAIENLGQYNTPYGGVNV